MYCFERMNKFLKKCKWRNPLLNKVNIVGFLIFMNKNLKNFSNWILDLLNLQYGQIRILKIFSYL